jgi:hypothetical protein
VKLRRWFLTAFGVTLQGLAATALVAWFVGRVVSDRYGWSQFLLWIPTPVAITAAALGLIGSLTAAERWKRRRGVLIAWLTAIVALMIYFTLLEHRLLHAAPDGNGGLRIVHWSMGHGKADRMHDHTQALLELDGDITIANEGGELFYYRPPQEWKPPGARLVQSWPFWVLTKMPILVLRPLAAVDGMAVSLLVVDATAKFGRPIVIWMVNLPSDPRLPRMAMVQRLGRLLRNSGAPMPDVVIGDLNITRGSAALQELFPGYHHAYDEAGHGYGASYHRRFPMYHIDHVLLHDGVEATRYDLVDPGMGRHRVQVVALARTTSDSAAR